MLKIPQAYKECPTLEAFIIENVKDEHHNVLSESRKEEVKGNLLMCVFHKQSDREWRNRVKTTFAHFPETGQHISTLRTALMTHYVINRPYKLGLIRELQGARRLAKTGLHEDTFYEAKECLTKKQRAILKSISNRLPIEMPTPKDQDRILDQILRDTETYLTKFAWRKLRFIADSNRFPVSYLISDLQEKIINTLRWQYPFKTELHLINSCKQSARNHGLNMISHWNTKKRKRLSQDIDGNFVNSQVMITDDVAQYSPFSDLHDTMTYRQMEKQFKGSKLLLFRLITGNENCTPFLKWACEELNDDYDSIDDLSKYLGPDGYRTLIAEYTNRSEDYIDGFIKTLKEKYHQAV